MGPIIQDLEWRYATKAFNSTQKISDDNLQALTESLRLSASSFGLQPWKFLFIADQKVKEELLPHSWNQKQVVDCSHQVVFCCPNNFTEADVDRFLEFTAKERGQTVESLAGYGKVIKGFLGSMSAEEIEVWMRKQVYIALGSFLSTCAQLRIDACPMEGIIPAEYDRILKLKDQNLKSVVACAIGYRSVEDKYASAKKIRYPLNEVVAHI